MRLLLATPLLTLLALSPSLGAPAPLLRSEALASPPASDPAATLFTELDADAIGVGSFVNDYSGPLVFGDRWRDYILGSIGTGVAVGDIDGDDLPDIFAVSKDEQNRLYRNLGGLRFQDITETAGITDSPHPGAGASFAAIDNDGDLDLYVCYVGGGNQLWINDGTGHFTEQAARWGIAIDNGCTQASFADYDRDGDLDFYLQNNLITRDGQSRELPDQLFENRGDHFIEVTAAAGISGAANGHSALWWDYDEDGWPDIYVANDYQPLDRLYHNNRDGTFTDVISSVIPQAPYYSMGSDFGDIDNNGHDDLFVCDMAATSHAKHVRTVGNHGHIYGYDPKGATPQSLKNVLLLNIAPQRYLDIAFLAGLAASDWTWAPRLADLNNDGRLDVFITNGMLRSFHDGDLAMRRVQYSEDEAIRAVFHHQPVLREHNLAFENLGGLRFADRGAAWGLDKLGVSFGAAFADLDRDGDLDLVINNFGEKLSVFRNNETSGHRVNLRLRGTTSNSHGIGARVTLTAGDLRQRKTLALMRGYMSTDEPILHFGLGHRDTIDRIEILWPSGIRQTLTGLAADRHYTITEPAADTAATADAPPDTRAAPPPRFQPAAVELPPEAAREEAWFSDFNKQPLLPFPESRIGGKIAFADLNADARLDIVLTGALGRETTVLLNEGSGRFAHAFSVDLETDFGCEDWDLQIVDWNGDDAPDLLVASGGVESPEGDDFYINRVYLNDGHGEFTREWSLPFDDLRNATRVARAADIDADGDLDIFFGEKTIPHKYPLAPASSLWRNDGGTFNPVPPADIPGLAEAGRIADAAWADLDNDGDPDLVAVREWDTPLSWINDGRGRFQPRPLTADPAATRGLWTCLALADLDADGRLDIVAGNLGLNSEYSATPDAPIRLWHSDGSDGRVRLIETFLDGGIERVREVKWRLEKEFPREMRRIRTLAQFAEMPLSRMFPRLEERGYRALEATELRSGIFWQEADGTFTFSPLPAFAQSGRAMGLLVADADADDRPDLILSLEYPSPEPWSGRIEKGHLALCLNRGQRHFETAPDFHGGLLIDGSPRGMAWGDLDGDGRPELGVYLSEGMPQFFRRSAD
ncbi:MAG: hypothetical protein D6781_10220 [Verrucomicrobia bacterium]|nr:MAG: hypothetical protein D6781_10220 [Verrucomicrobiota bacterium]